MSGSLYNITLHLEMVAAFPSKYAVIVGELNLQELIRIIRHWIKCARSHSTEYDVLNYIYLAVAEELYVVYAPLVLDKTGDPVLDINGVQKRPDTPDEPENPG